MATSAAASSPETRAYGLRPSYPRRHRLQSARRCDGELGLAAGRTLFYRESRDPLRSELPVGTPIRLEGRCLKRKGRLAQMEGRLIRKSTIMWWQKPPVPL